MESEFFKMDLFFTIASVFAVIIGTIVVLILWKILRLVGKVDEVGEKIKFIANKWLSKLKINNIINSNKKKKDHDKQP